MFHPWFPLGDSINGHFIHLNWRYIWFITFIWYIWYIYGHFIQISKAYFLELLGRCPQILMRIKNGIDFYCTTVKDLHFDHRSWKSHSMFHQLQAPQVPESGPTRHCENVANKVAMTGGLVMSWCLTIHVWFLVSSGYPRRKGNISLYLACS